MCGIVYSKSLVGKPVSNTIIKRFKNQRERGTDGFGFYIPDSNRLTHNTREGRTLSLLRRVKDSEILFHHRLPTSTVNVRNACHPFSTKDHFEHNYVVVHNGVLHNEDVLAKEHAEKGIKYVSLQEDGSFNDSEALAYDLAMYLEGEQDTIKAVGSIAFIAIKRNKLGKPISLIYGRNSGNPLVRKETKHSLTLSSKGEGENIATNTIYEYSYKTGKTTERFAYIKTSEYSSSTYPYANRYDSQYGEYDTPRYGEYNPNTQSYNWEGYELEDEDLAIIERMEVSEMRDALLYDANYDYLEAYDMANDALKLLKFEADSLWTLYWAGEELGTRDQLDEHYEADRKVQQMKKVIEQIREGALGRNTSMGFQQGAITGGNIK